MHAVCRRRHGHSHHRGARMSVAVLNLDLATLKFDVDDSGIALLTIDVPDRSMNVLTPRLISDLAAAVECIATTPSIKGAIVTSGKPSGFLAGADLTELVEQYRPGLTPASSMKGSRELSGLFR